uniref:Ground-like domain-containing protein n=1 Tax=Panagrellus redivivus TaxID=6233 RepID=A0A7E4ZSB4_PANRE
MLLLAAIFSLVSIVEALFFGGGGNSGCGCQSACPVYPPCPIVAPICPPAPVYAPCPVPVAATYPAYSPYSYGGNYQDCCATCATPCLTKSVKQVTKNALRLKRDTPEEYEAFEEELLAAEEASTPTSSNIDPKCNSERLRQIIIMSAGRDVSVAKRNIQLIAEKQFQVKYNVICSSDGDFSYITSTEEYCQDVINGKTCYIFKQFDRSHVHKGRH